MIFSVIRRFSKFCQGCGCTFQHINPEVEGFIPENKYKNTLIHNIKTSDTLQNIQRNDEIKLRDFKLTKPEASLYQNPEFEDLDSIEEIEERSKSAIPLYEYQKKPKLKPIICMRCYKISKYGQLPQVDCEITSKPPLTSLNEIFDPIKFESIVLYVIDLIDFNGSLIKEVFDISMQKKAHVILILNKIDALPLNAKLERIYQWGINETRNLFKNLDVAPVSARTGEGYSKVIKILKELNESTPDSRVYVLGATNSGKSSFINTLAKKCWDLPEEKFKRPLTELTTSKYPGTTLSPIEISLRSLKMKIVDTPGIPTLSQITFFLSSQDATLLIPNKKIKPVVLTATPEFTFWIGALVKIEMVSGDFKYLTFFVSHMCTIHKTRKNLAEDVYERQAGKLLKPKYNREIEWEQRVVDINCVSKEKATKDIVIHGLGWISVTGLGECRFIVHLCKNVGFNIREPLMPYEAKPDLVQFTKGHTINSEKYKIIKN